MSENNYGALMMKSAIGASDDINAIFQPGIYIIPPSNTSSPDATGGVLTVHSGTPIRRTFTSDSVICLTSTRNGSTWSLWKGPLSRINPFADIKADGAAAVAAALSNLGLGGASKCDVGTTEGTVAAGNDGRFGKMLGVGQSIQNVTASRALGITYTNSTGRPIFVSVTCKGQPQPSSTELYISGVLACTSYKATSSDAAVSGVVPAGAEYSIKVSGGNINNWAELR